MAFFRRTYTTTIDWVVTRRRRSLLLIGLGLLLAYVFPSETFPWAALWYERGGSAEAPYNGRTTAWGIEFGTCALPQGQWRRRGRTAP
jgi:O-antigen ligase